MYSAAAVSSAGTRPTHSRIGRPVPASKTLPSPLAISSVTRSAGSLTTSIPRVVKAKNFPAPGSLSPVADSIFPRSTPRRRLAARSKISSTSVLVMAAHPGLSAVALVAAFRDEGEVGVGGVGEEGGAVAPREDAEAFPVGKPWTQRAVVVELLVLLLRGKRNSVVEVEIRPAGRDPVEVPPHSPAVRLELLDRGARDGCKGDVPRVQMNHVRVEVVGPERAALAADVVLGREHEVVDDQLAAAVEQVGERLLAVRALEDVLLLDRLPGQGLPLPGHLVAGARELLLLSKELLARLEPLVGADDAHMPSGPTFAPGSPPPPAMTRRPR